MGIDGLYGKGKPSILARSLQLHLTSLHIHALTTIMLLASISLKFSSFLASLAGIMDTGMDGIVSSIGRDQLPLGQELSQDASPTSNLLLSDVLTIQSASSIFFSYARDTKVGELLHEKGSEMTVFAPTNKAVMALARKP